MENMVFSLYGLQVARPGRGAFRLQIRRLEAQRGQLLALVGPSGCGKSTALDVLAGILRPECRDDARFLLHTADGETDILALWQGNRLDRLARLRGRHLGYVLQTGGLLPFLSARDNILLPCRCLGRLGHRLEAVWNMATALGLDRLLQQMPSSLSVGERQRVAIARALAHGPDIVLADEPTAALDPQQSRNVLGIFADLARQQETTVVMVTHDPRMAEDAGFTLVPMTCSSTDDGPLSVIDHPGW
ncbi:ATP-binding cassette domain-containing protein [uncultured Desulfovibrio sp.]|uniref:ABC transporter ATP-binding protein n=1 Tax=uncultured Desulfovibrio sp. TaxID=167968 RepID=UPI00260ADE8F|nr:ATP-binding cassette domain-containing protein [uncultured Desulfovibrio sp.]